MTKSLLTLAPIAITYLACGGQSAPLAPPTATGSVSGMSLDAKDAYAWVQSSSDHVSTSYGPPFSKVIVRLSNPVRGCTSETLVEQLVGHTYLVLVAYRPGTEPVGVGRYVIPAPPILSQPSTLTGSAEFNRRESICMDALSPTDMQAIGGEVVVSSISSAEVTGSFKAVFHGGEIDGTFTAPICTSGDASDHAVPLDPSRCEPDAGH